MKINNPTIKSRQAILMKRLTLASEYIINNQKNRRDLNIKSIKIYQDPNKI